MDIAAALQKTYDSEINVEISWLWDGGIEVRLGDRLNGFVAETTVPLVADILPWLQEAIAHFYPDSTYAKELPNGGQGPCAAPDLRCTQGRCAGEVSALRVAQSELGSNGGDHCLRLHALWSLGGSSAP